VRISFTAYVLQDIRANDVCAAIRSLPLLWDYARRYPLIIRCEVAVDDPESVKVTIVSGGVRNCLWVLLNSCFFMKATLFMMEEGEGVWCEHGNHSDCSSFVFKIQPIIAKHSSVTGLFRKRSQKKRSALCQRVFGRKRVKYFSHCIICQHWRQMLLF